MASVLQFVFELYLWLVCLCVMLRCAGADYYNPVIQRLIRVTNPVLKPFRMILPDIGSIDTGGFVGAVFVKLLELVCVFLLTGLALNGVGLLFLSCVLVLKLMLTILFYAILLQAVLSWFNPGNRVLVDVLLTLTRPILGVFQSWLPTLGGIDFSPLVAILALQLINYVVLNALMTFGISLLNG
jgi:YggT family protein